MLEEYAPDKWIAVSLKVQENEDGEKVEEMVIDILTGDINNLQVCLPKDES